MVVNLDKAHKQTLVGGNRTGKLRGISWGEATANPGSHFLSWFDGRIGALEGITRSFGKFEIIIWGKGQAEMHNQPLG